MDKNKKINRLDSELVNRGLVPTRELAKKLILASAVLVNDVTVQKPSFKVYSDSTLTIKDNDLTQYVSRGAYKLVAALDYFNIDVSSLIAVDFGASTGGFTDVLLKRGAQKVYAIENGVGQLHEKLQNDKRVISIENTNARYIEKGFIPLCDIAVMDVSFISQTKLYQSVVNVLKEDGIFISLIKPQFEAGKRALNKKGIVKNEKAISDVLNFIESTASEFSFKLCGCIDSPILGGDGNKEFLAYFKYIRGVTN